MLNFQLLIVILFSIIILILFSRIFSKRKFHFTSYYNEEKEYFINEILLIEKVTNSLKKSNFKNIKVINNQFTAITLPSIFSFSELICVNINKIDETKYIVRFNSRCFFPLQIFDWGKNKRNSNLFFKNLKASFLK